VAALETGDPAGVAREVAAHVRAESRDLFERLDATRDQAGESRSPGEQRERAAENGRI